MTVGQEVPRHVWVPELAKRIITRHRADGGCEQCRDGGCEADVPDGGEPAGPVRARRSPATRRPAGRAAGGYRLKMPAGAVGMGS
jgi:hypothetical protein